MQLKQMAEERLTPGRRKSRAAGATPRSRTGAGRAIRSDGRRENVKRTLKE